MSDMNAVARCLTPLPYKIGFVGGGKMAMALAKGFMTAGLVSPSQVFASAPSDKNLSLWRQLGATTSHNNTDIIRWADIIVIACKPHIFPLVVDAWRKEVKTTADMAPAFVCQESKLFASVMVGVTSCTLFQHLSSVVPNPRIIRVNPNTPSMIGCGASAYTLGKGATKEDGDLIKQLLSSVGITEMIPESQQNAFTGLVTSGPAYIYTIIEGLADGGVKMGLPRDLAVKFAAQMVMGSSQMVLQTGKHTGQLKDEVTSPGGTTIRGVSVLDRNGVRGILMDAIQASHDRGVELGKQ